MGDNCVLLTPAQNSKKGAMWYNTQTNLNCPFDYTYRVNLGDRDGDGADGIAFVLLKKNNVDGFTFGMPGEGIGYGVGVWAGNNYTVMQPALAIEIDTWYNGNFDLVAGAECDHISIHKNGAYKNPLLPPVSALVGNCNIEDGQYHTFRVKWDPTTKTIQAYMDGVLRITYTEDIINTIFGGAANVWWGYTASTGGAMNDQIVCPVWLQNEEVCAGQSFTLVYTGAEADQYIWNWDGATVTPGAGKGPHTVSWSSTGAKTVTLKTIKGQCTTDVALQKVYVVKPAPAAGFTATPQSRCVGQTIQAVFTAQEMAGATYRWNFDAGAVPTTATTKGPISVSWSTGGTKTIRLQVSLNGCVSEATQTVVIHSPPAAPTITGPSSICAGSALTLTASSLGATSYLWSGPNLPADSTSPSVTVLGLSAGAYAFRAQAISAANCTSAVTSQTITVNALPIISDIQSNSPICLGQVALITANLSTSQVSGAAYLWTGPNGFNQTTNTASMSIPGLSAGEHTFNLQVVGVNNCASTVSDITVAVHALPPTPDYSSNSPLCQGQDLTFTINAPLGEGWTYYVTGPNGFTHQFTSSFSLAKANVTVNDTGFYYLTVISGACASEPVAHRVLINVNPSPVALNNSPLCGPANLSLTVANPVSGVTYQWSAPDGVFFTGPNWSRGVSNPNMAGVYSLTATALGCPPQLVTSDVIIVSWDGLSVSSNSPACIQGALRLTASIDIPGAVYTWRAPGGQAIVTQEPTLEINPATLSHQGVYTLTASLAGCNSPEIFSSLIVILNLPQPALYVQSLGRAPFQNVCVGAEAAIRIINFNSFPPQTSYIWSTPKGTVNSNTPYLLIEVTAADSGNYAVVAAIGGCASPASIPAPLTVLPKPAPPQAANNTPLCEGSASIELRATFPEPGSTYIWSGPNGYTATGVTARLPSTVGASGIYSLVAVNSLGCTSAAATTNVVVQPFTGVAPRVSYNAPLCAGQNLQLTVLGPSGVTYTVTGPNNYSVLGQGPNFIRNNISSADAGVYRVAYREGCGIVESTITVVITAPLPPITAFNTGPYCANETLTLSASNTTPGAAYIWSGPAQFMQTGQVVTRANMSDLFAGAYSVVAVLGGCSSNVAVTNVIVTSLPTPLILSSNSPLCAGSSLLLSANGTDGVSYTFSGPGFIQTATRNFVMRSSITTAQAGLYSVVASVGRCSVSAVTNVTVFSAPALTGLQSNAPICVGGTLVLTAEAVNATSFFWQGPGGFTSTSAAPFVPNFSASAAGTYHVVAIAGGCTSQAASISVTLGALAPQPAITANATSLCQGQTLILTASGSGNVVYFWQGPEGARYTGATVELSNITPAQAGFYEVVAVAGGCTSSPARINIAVQMFSGSLSPSSNAPLCVGQTVQLTANSTFTGVTYEWSGPGCFRSALPNPSFLASSTAQAGVYTITVRSGTCSRQATVNIVINQAEQVLITGTRSLCQGQTLQLTAVGNPLAVYAWSGPNGFSATGASVQIPGANSLVAGRYTVTATLGNCPPMSASQEVEVFNALVLHSISSNSPVCEGSALQLSVNAVAGAQYLWTGPNGFTSSNQNFTISPARFSDAGVYSVAAWIGGCSSQVLSTRVNVISGVAAPQISGCSLVCAGNPLTLSANSTTPGASYIWSLPGGATQYSQVLNINRADASHNGRYSVVAVAGNCTSQASSALVRVSTLTAQWGEAAREVCSRQMASLPLRLTGIAPFLVKYSDGVRSYEAQLNGTYADIAIPGLAATYTLQEAEDAVGCKIYPNVSVNVTVTPAPTATFTSGGSTVCQGSLVEIGILLTGKGPWSLTMQNNGQPVPPIALGNLGSASPFLFTQTVLAGSSQNFTLQQVKDSNGCLTNLSSSYALSVRQCPERCPAPNQVTVRPLTHTSAAVNWRVASGNPVCYVLSYGPLNNPFGWKSTLIPHPNTAFTLENLTAGENYGIQLRSNCGSCSIVSGDISYFPSEQILTMPSKVSEAATSSLEVWVYPNPTKGLFTLSFSEPLAWAAQYQILNLSGAMVAQDDLRQGVSDLEVSLSGLPAGLYLCKVNLPTGSKVIRLLKE
jgi:hypothetical protein